MGYRIEPGEGVEGALRRIAREQVERALATLESASEGVHEKVHEARKRGKKVRALLRLVRPAFEKTYQVENARYRDAARPLSGLRDATAFLECFNALMERYGADVDGRRFAPIRSTLLERREALGQAQDVHGRLEAFRDRMQAARERIDDWKLEEEGFAAIAPGVAKTYGRARDALAAAYEDPSAPAFHELRKRSKYHRFHCRLLRNLWKPLLDARRDEAKRLSDLLGDSHDIAELLRVLSDEEARFAHHQNLGDLVALLERRQHELRAWARPLGERLFDEKPKRFVARLGENWRAWQREQRTAGKLDAASPEVHS